MTKKTTLVNFLLDETGSMTDITLPTISGFNEYVGGLKNNQDGPMKFTLTQFNSEKIEVVHKAIPISKVPELTTDTYKPDHMTPLYDALARTIEAMDKKIKRFKTKPIVLTVIFTDGEENHSKLWTREKIFELIKEKESEGWVFVYLGAHKDAYLDAHKMGILTSNVIQMDHSPAGMSAGYAAANMATRSFVQTGGTKKSGYFGDTDEDEPSGNDTPKDAWGGISHQS